MNTTTKICQNDVKQMLIDNAHAYADYLPTTLAHLAGLVGLDKTMMIMEAFGGLDLLIPKTPAGTVYDSLVAVVGKSAAAAIVHAFGGEKLYINRCESLKRQLRDQAFLDNLHKLMATGISQSQAIRQLALAFDFSERYGYEILRRSNDDGGQLWLF